MSTLALIGDVLVTAGCLGLPRAPISLGSSGVNGKVKGLGLELVVRTTAKVSRSHARREPPGDFPRIVQC